MLVLMTKIKNKYHTIQLLGLATATLLLVTILAQTSIQSANAQTTSDDFKKLPKLLTKGEEDQLTERAL